MIIDSHTHISKLENSKFAFDFSKNLKYLIAEMKENKVDHALIFAGFRKEDSMNASNETILKLTEKIKNVNVVGSIDVINHTKDDLVTLEEQISRKKIVGVKLYTGYQHFYPSDDKCKPIYELCIKYQIPVIFHSGDTLAGYTEKPKVKYSHPLHIDEIATDFPDLKIIIAHMGNPWLLDCAEVIYKNPNVYADISGMVVGEGLDTNYGKIMRERIMELIAYSGDGIGVKILYGTDWPLCTMETYTNFVKNLGLSKETMDQIFYKNAVKLFKLYKI